MKLSQVIKGLLAACFTLSAVVQYNDPDGLLWGMIYGYCALMFGWSLISVLPKLPLLIGILAYGVGFLYYLPNFHSDWIHDEVTREGLGLLICCLSLLGVLVTHNYSRLRKRHQPR